jgi:hypothetical protein
MVFKKDLRAGKGAQIIKHTGKGASEQSLPSRSALNTLTKGDPLQRSMNNYAKETPGPADDVASPDIMSMASGPGPI